MSCPPPRPASRMRGQATFLKCSKRASASAARLAAAGSRSNTWRTCASGRGQGGGGAGQPAQGGAQALALRMFKKGSQTGATFFV